MEGILAMLADKQQPLVRTIGSTGMPAHRARLARVVRVYFDRHRAMQEGFVSNHAVQFRKSPFGVGGIGLSLLLVRLVAFLAAGSLADVFQIFQTDELMGVPGHDAFRDSMIGVLRSPVSLAR